MLTAWGISFCAACNLLHGAGHGIMIVFTQWHRVTWEHGAHTEHVKCSTQGSGMWHTGRVTKAKHQTLKCTHRISRQKTHKCKLHYVQSKQIIYGRLKVDIQLWSVN